MIDPMRRDDWIEQALNEALENASLERLHDRVHDVATDWLESESHNDELIASPEDSMAFHCMSQMIFGFSRTEEGKRMDLTMLLRLSLYYGYRYAQAVAEGKIKYA